MPTPGASSIADTRRQFTGFAASSGARGCGRRDHGNLHESADPSHTLVPVVQKLADAGGRGARSGTMLPLGSSFGACLLRSAALDQKRMRDLTDRNGQTGGASMTADNNWHAGARMLGELTVCFIPAVFVGPSRIYGRCRDAAPERRRSSWCFCGICDSAARLTVFARRLAVHRNEPGTIHSDRSFDISVRGPALGGQ
jgi:hypothetical protein